MPNGTSTSTETKIVPVFKRVQQAENFDCIFACISTISGQTLDAVMQVAREKLRHPPYGPYFVTEEKIAALFVNYGLVSTVWKEVHPGITNLPDVSILLVDYDADLEIGRHVVFVRDKTNPKKPIEYVIDPGYWLNEPMHVRTDVKALRPAWYIGVHPAAK